MQTAIVIVPAVLVLYAVARLSARHELQILRDQLRDEVARGVLSDDEYAVIIDGDARRRALVAARGRGGESSVRGSRRSSTPRPNWPSAATIAAEGNRSLRARWTRTTAIDDG